MFFSFWYEMNLESMWGQELLKWLSMKDKTNQYGNSAIFKVFSSNYLNCHKEVFEITADL